MWIGQPAEWVVEVKMARLRGDNGKPDDMTIKKVISPYARDHSAVTDASKLAESAFSAEKAIIIYGFDYPNQALDPLIDAFETLADRRVELGPRYEFRSQPASPPGPRSWARVRVAHRPTARAVVVPETSHCGGATTRTRLGNGGGSIWATFLNTRPKERECGAGELRDALQRDC